MSSLIALAYEMIYAVTDPRLTSIFHDERLERTYVHHADGFDLLASETPPRLTMPLAEWLPTRYLVSYQQVDPHSPLAPGGQAILEMKLLVLRGSLEDALRPAAPQPDGPYRSRLTFPSSGARRSCSSTDRRLLLRTNTNRARSPAPCRTPVAGGGPSCCLREFSSRQ